jgi:2-keto-4-pentenoate hydratase
MEEAKHYAKMLREALITGKTIDPIRDQIKDKGIEYAYKIQEINNLLREEKGSRLIGRKIGLTSKAVQKQLGVDQPDFGALFHDMEVLTGQEISVHQLQQPKIEAEMAIVLGQDLDFEQMSMVDVMASIDYVLPAIEIVGSRIKDWDIKIWDTVADNASASHFVLGHSPKTLDEFDIIACQMKMYKQGELISEGTGANCLGSPLNALFWLANTMLQLDEPLQEGDLILTGSLGIMAPVVANDHFEVEFSGLGKVSVGFNDVKISG